MEENDDVVTTLFHLLLLTIKKLESNLNLKSVIPHNVDSIRIEVYDEVKICCFVEFKFKF
jgi:hypothetical protein